MAERAASAELARLESAPGGPASVGAAQAQEIGTELRAAEWRLRS